MSVDQYESSVHSQRLETHSRERTEHRFCGGTPFCDHALKRIFNVNQTSLFAHETIQATQAFELEALTCGGDQ